MTDTQSADRPITPAAAWMDRLPERLGALVPGGSRLPARHPVKVCLVMGALGSVAGALFAWDSVIWPLIPDSPLKQTVRQILLVSEYTCASVIVLAPLCLWSGCRPWLVVLSPVPGIANYLIWISILRFFDYAKEAFDELTWIWLSDLYNDITCAILASTYALFFSFIVHRRRMIIVGLSTILCFLEDAAFQRLVPLIGSISGPWFDQIGFSMLHVAFWSSIYATIAICLSIAIWDGTPRQKFEPREAEITDS